MTIELSQLIDGWNEFFFADADAHPIAQFRIAFGLILLVEAAFIGRNLQAYLGPDGMVRHSTFVRQSAGRVLSLFLYLPPTMRTVRGVFALHVIAVTCMTLGLFAEMSTLVTFVTMRSIINRNPTICNGGDNVAKIMCFLLIFADPGATWSLDAMLWGQHGDIGDPWALRLMQIQVSLIYVWTAFWKLAGSTYRNGTALYYSVSNVAYRRARLPGVLLRPPLLQALTWSALVLELAIGPALWIEELRTWAVLAGIAFHVVIDYALNVHLFGWYMIAGLLLFVDLTTVF